jgi:hypothetical protein
MQVIGTLLIVGLFATLWYLSDLPRHYRSARKTNLPILIGPVYPGNPVWFVISHLYSYSAVERLLPTFLFDRVKVAIQGWEFRCKHTVHDALGLSFILVTPGGNSIFTADPDLVVRILSRRKDFQRVGLNAGKFCEAGKIHLTDLTSESMQLFGPNILTVLPIPIQTPGYGDLLILNTNRLSTQKTGRDIEELWLLL